jgi:hypothetical protein
VVELAQTLLHLGPLHPAERVLTLVLAFGPFLLLALTIWITRRRHAEDAARGEDDDG